jgi:sugar lactone lactonase YvrE
VRRWLALAAAAAACTACGSGAGLHVEDGGRTVPPGRIAPDTTQAHARRPPPAEPGVHLGGPAALSYDAGTLWCAVYAGPGLIGSLVEVDTATGRRSGTPVPLPPAARPYLLAVGPDGVWLAAGRRLWRIDPDAAQVATTTQLPGLATALQDSAGSVWATVTRDGAGRLVRVDAATAKVAVQAPVGPSPSALTVAAGAAWVTDSLDQSIFRFSLAKGQVRRSGEVSLPRSAVRAPTQVTVFNGFVWVYERGRVLRISPSNDRVLGTTRVASVADGTIAAGSGGIWIVTRTRERGRGAVRMLDAATGLAAGPRIVVGGRPTAIVTDGRSAWVLDSDANRLVRVSPT